MNKHQKEVKSNCTCSGPYCVGPETEILEYTNQLCKQKGCSYHKDHLKEEKSCGHPVCLHHVNSSL